MVIEYIPPVAGNLCSDNPCRMEWHVRYLENGTDRLEWYPSPEAAIESACRHMDAGRTVRGIGTDDVAYTIAPDQITHIYAIWVRGKSSFGIRVV